MAAVADGSYRGWDGSSAPAAAQTKGETVYLPVTLICLFFRGII